MSNIVKILNTEIVAVDNDWIKSRDTLLTHSANVQAVANIEENEIASELLRKITKISNALETRRKELCDPLNRAAKEVKSAGDTARAPLENEKARLKSLLADYAEAEYKKRQAERRAAEDAERQRAAEAAAEIEAAETLGIDTPEVVEVAIPETPAQPLIQSAGGTRTSVAISWRLIDESAVPEAFKVFDPRKVNEFKRSLEATIKAAIEKGEQPIPGIEFFEEIKIASR